MAEPSSVPSLRLERSPNGATAVSSVLMLIRPGRPSPYVPGASKYFRPVCVTMVSDHGMLASMEEISISKFKATCLALLDRVNKTGQPILVTKRGVPVAQVSPPPVARPEPGSWFGAMKGTARELGDIVAPLYPDGIEPRDFPD